jgi:hypothetical protein
VLQTPRRPSPRQPKSVALWQFASYHCRCLLQRPESHGLATLFNISFSFLLSGWTEISAPSFVRANPLLHSGAMVVPTVARGAVFRIPSKENANVNQKGRRR